MTSEAVMPASDFIEISPLPMICYLNGAVAQLGERLNGIQEVVGSIPISSTFKIKGNWLKRPIPFFI